MLIFTVKFLHFYFPLAIVKIIKVLESHIPFNYFKDLNSKLLFSKSFYGGFCI